MNFGKYIGSNVPSLKEFRDTSTNLQKGTFSLKALSSAMLLLQRYSRIRFYALLMSKLHKAS